MKLNNNDDSHNSGLNLLIYNMLLDIESHPTWVCGLKQFVRRNTCNVGKVTPYVGVWIETRHCQTMSERQAVTPYVGVWIETKYMLSRIWIEMVTPYVGVWIETTGRYSALLDQSKVTPYVGVWIETIKEENDFVLLKVTPYVGVWIETTASVFGQLHPWSHPTWVCGLKQLLEQLRHRSSSHTLRGCVD